MVSYLDQGGVQHLVDKLLDRMYPVNSIYISTNSTSPASLYGGSWERYGTGRVLVSADDSDTDFTAGKTGGKKNIELTVPNLPDHRHKIAARVAGDSNYGSGAFVMDTWTYQGQSGGVPRWTFADLEGTRPAGWHPDPIDLMNPYIAVYIWRRTA